MEENTPIIWVNWQKHCGLSYMETESKYLKIEAEIDEMFQSAGYLRIQHRKVEESIYVRLRVDHPYIEYGAYEVVSVPVRNAAGELVAYGRKKGSSQIGFLAWEHDGTGAEYIDEEHLAGLEAPSQYRIRIN